MSKFCKFWLDLGSGFQKMAVYEIFVLFMNLCVVKSSMCSAVFIFINYWVCCTLGNCRIEVVSILSIMKIVKIPFVWLCKVHIFWEGHKILRNLYRRLVLCSANQIYGEDFVKFCGFLRIYELYKLWSNLGHTTTFISQVLALKVSQQKTSWNKNSLGNFWIKFCNFGYDVPLSLFNNL